MQTFKEIWLRVTLRIARRQGEPPGGDDTPPPEDLSLRRLFKKKQKRSGFNCDATGFRFWEPSRLTKGDADRAFKNKIEPKTAFRVVSGDGIKVGGEGGSEGHDKKRREPERKSVSEMAAVLVDVSRSRSA